MTRRPRWQKLTLALVGMGCVVGIAWMAYAYGSDVGTPALWAVVALAGVHGAGNVTEHITDRKRADA